MMITITVSDLKCILTMNSTININTTLKPYQRDIYLYYPRVYIIIIYLGLGGIENLLSRYIMVPW